MKKFLATAAVLFTLSTGVFAAPPLLFEETVIGFDLSENFLQSELLIDLKQEAKRSVLENLNKTQPLAQEFQALESDFFATLNGELKADIKYNLEHTCCV